MHVIRCLAKSVTKVQNDIGQRFNMSDQKHDDENNDSSAPEAERQYPANEGDRPEIVHQEPVPTYFIDGVRGFATGPHVVKMGLYEQKFDPSTKIVSNFTVMNLVMDKETFRETVKWLNSMVEKADNNEDAT